MMTDQYAQYISEADKALQLAAAKDDVEQAFINKLKARRVRACVMLGDLSRAGDLLNEDKEQNEELSSLQKVVQSGLEFHPTGLTTDEARLHFAEKDRERLTSLQTSTVCSNHRFQWTLMTKPQFE